VFDAVVLSFLFFLGVFVVIGLTALAVAVAIGYGAV